MDAIGNPALKFFTEHQNIIDEILIRTINNDVWILELTNNIPSIRLDAKNTKNFRKSE